MGRQSKPKRKKKQKVTRSEYEVCASCSGRILLDLDEWIRVPEQSFHWDCAPRKWKRFVYKDD